MQRSVLVVLSVAQLVVLAKCGDFTFPISSSQSCKKKEGCENSCAAEGKQCCFCDETKNFGVSACFCCPKDHFCCSTDTRLGSSGTVCCPNGYNCSRRGWGPTCTKLVDIPAVAAAGYCNKKCRPATYAYVTVDDSFTLSIDGVQQQLVNDKNWTLPDRIPISSKAKLITISGTNELYKAGILISAENPDVLNKASWRCASSVDPPPSWWNNLDVDDSNWPGAVGDEYNDGMDSRKVRVPYIPSDTRWVWCENPGTLRTVDWSKYCTCRIWLPESLAASYN